LLGEGEETASISARRKKKKKTKHEKQTNLED
jgi:hypothetical protein